MRLSNVAFAQRDLLRLPDEDGRCGAVVAANVPHLLARPDPAWPGPAVRELWRVTAPGGLLILPAFLTGEAGAPFRAAL